ncbi:MAG: hypothetical protein ACI90V_011425, partial [Bacillariaceae sp.]
QRDTLPTVAITVTKKENLESIPMCPIYPKQHD